MELYVSNLALWTTWKNMPFSWFWWFLKISIKFDLAIKSLIFLKSMKNAIKWVYVFPELDYILHFMNPPKSSFWLFWLYTWKNSKIKCCCFVEKNVSRAKFRAEIEFYVKNYPYSRRNSQNNLLYFILWTQQNRIFWPFFESKCCCFDAKNVFRANFSALIEFFCKNYP